MSGELLQFTPGDAPELNPLGEGPDQQVIAPFGVMEGMLTPLPAEAVQELNMGGSIYPTATDGNDREGDRD